MEERLTENCLWYLFLRAKYVFSIPFMSMMESTKVSAMLLMEERLLTENCLLVSFPPREICIFYSFYVYDGVNKGQIFLSFTNFNDLFLV